MTDGRTSISRRCAGEAATRTLAGALARLLAPGTVVALRGDLGAGKTRFVRGLAEALGHDPALVNSPTYVFANEYDEDPAATPLIHVDAWRLESSEALETIGWDCLLRDEVIIAVEWADRIADALPDDAVDVLIEHAEGDVRDITITGPYDRVSELAHAGGAT